MVLLQKETFFHLFFLGNIGKENVFYDIVKRKKRLSSLQKQEVEKVKKIDIFPKGLRHGFAPKIAIFPTFFLSNICRQNVFYDILERKNAFLGYKNRNLKKSKN